MNNFIDRIPAFPEQIYGISAEGESVGLGGREGGTEGLQCYTVTRNVSHKMI